MWRVDKKEDMEMNNKRFNSIIVASAVTFLLLVVLSSTASANTFKVGSGQTYTSVQDAVDHAKTGDTIKVYYGDYKEYVYVYSSLKIQGVASGKKLPKIRGFYIWGGSPVISNFDISGEGYDYGIYVGYGCPTIMNNKFNVASTGLYIDSYAFKNTKKSQCPKVKNNIFNGCDYGVYIDSGDNPGKLLGFTGNKYSGCDTNIGGSWQLASKSLMKKK
jgi:nitrous oxidase accessory protein NosD